MYLGIIYLCTCWIIKCFNHRQSRLRQSISWPRFEPATTLIQGQSVTTRTFFGYLQPSQQSLRLTAFEISLCQTNLMIRAHTSLAKQLTFGSRKIIVTLRHEPLQVITFFQVVYFKALCNLKTHTHRQRLRSSLQ